MIVHSLHKVAHNLKLPAFTLSFFLLGLLTSLPEITIGITAIAVGDPTIYVGNLIGGIVVLFLLIIPLMGLTNNGVSVPKQLDGFLIILILLVSFLPTFFVRDNQVTILESVISICAYGSLGVYFTKKQAVLERLKNNLKIKRKINTFDIVKIIGGILILLVGSNQIVRSTQYFAEVLEMSPFFVSLVIVSFGSNIPEFTLIFRSMVHKSSDIVLADYLGSASANTLLFGLLGLMYGKTVQIPTLYVHRLLFLIIGLLTLYLFLRSKNHISRWECLVLLLIYIAFIIVELLVI
jgi:cation:H+ antiporter